MANWITKINLQQSTAECCICGETDSSRWGVPISMKTGEVVANDFVGDWAAKPACRHCWQRHQSGEFVGLDPQF
jgi:hypothetical protein